MPIDFNTCRATKSGNIILPKGRLTFAQNILVPGKPKNAPAAQESKYGTSQLIPKAGDLTLLKNAIKACAVEKYGAKIPPAGLKYPILEAKDYEYEGYTDQFWLIRPTSKQKPGIVNAAGVHVGDDEARSEIYSGRWACLSVRCFHYDFGKPGIGLGLQNIQLLDHDESLGGRARAEDEFEAVEGATSNSGGGATHEDPFA